MSKKSLYGYMRIKMKKLYTISTRRIYPNCLYIPLFRFLFSSLDTGGRVVRKCEKDFDRKVFSFLYILLDALPLSKFNWATLPSTEKMIRKEIGVFYCSPTKFRVLNRELGKESR